MCDTKHCVNLLVCVRLLLMALHPCAAGPRGSKGAGEAGGQVWAAVPERMSSQQLQRHEAARAGWGLDAAAANPLAVSRIFVVSSGFNVATL